MGSGTSNNQINNYRQLFGEQQRMKTLVDERIRTEPCESKAFSPWEEMQIQRIKVNPKTNLLELVRKKQRRPFQEYRRTNLIDMFKPKQQIEVSVDQMLTSSRGPSLPKRRSLQPQQTLEVVQTSKLEKSINEEGNSQINQYTVVGTLGQGSFGKVKQAQNYKGELFAIKIANKKKLKKKLLAKSNAYSMLEREIAIMKKVKKFFIKICHPNVVQLFEVIDDPDQDKLYLVMEYMGKGSILSKGFFNKSTNILDEISPVNSKNQLNEIKCRHYFRQFILGLDYLHQVVNVIHRDIKPENLLVSNDDVLKIADFGVSHIMEEGSDGKISNQTGTQSFLAPEAFKGSNFDGKPVDVWAGGVTLYQMIYNKLPFPSMKPQELRQQILEDNPQFKVPQGFSPSVISLLKGMLEKNPTQRLTVEQIMEHEWLTEYGQQPLLLNQDMEFTGVTDMEIKLAITTLNLSNYFIWQEKLEKQQHQRKKIKLYMDHKKKIPEERYKLEIFVKAQNLVDLDTFSKSDPYCKLLHHIQGEDEIDVGNTEWLKNNLSPQWETTFVIDYIFELSQKLTFQVWDHNGGEDSIMGKVSTTVADIIGCKDMKVILDLKTKDGKPGGQLFVNIDKQMEDNQFLQLQWIGQDLMNTDGYFGKSDPFLKFYKKQGDDWLPVHKTEMIKDDLNPIWKPFQISVKRLSGSNLEQQFKVECWDVHNKGFNNQYMGKFYVSVHEIINENKTEFNLDYKKEKSGGKIILKDKRLIKRPTFMDFLKDGEQINLIIAVDYTAQNGNQNFGDSLHAILQNGQLNQYETAIKSCAQILLNYDYDKKVALYGFGCIPHLANYNQAETEQCFPLTGDYKKPEVYGLDGIMNLYKQTLPNLQFSGPAQLNPIIEYAKQIAEYNKKKRIYTALLILTCGEIHDLHLTSELLSTCATVPLSVILVGVGDFEFKKLELLDQEQKVHQKEHITRDVVQFVPYAPNSHNLPILQRALLAELPHQLVQYKSLMGLVPQNY